MYTLFPGNIGVALDATKTRGVTGLEPLLAFDGSLTSCGYGPGATALLGAELYFSEISCPVASASVQPKTIGPNSSGDVTFTFHLSGAIVDAIERKRNGKDVKFIIQPWAALIDPGEGKQRCQTGPANGASAELANVGQHTLQYSPNDWAKVMHGWERAAAITFPIFLPGASRDAGMKEVLSSLIKAQNSILANDFAGSISHARKGIDTMRSFYKETLPKRKDQTPKEREADMLTALKAYIDSLYSYASAPAHDNEKPMEGIEWNRENAVMVLAGAAGIAQRYCLGTKHQ